MKKFFSIALLLTILSATHAQRYDVCRLSVGFNGGVSSFTVSDQNLNGSSKMGAEYGTELGFAVFFSQHWGIRTGLGVSVFNGEFNCENITMTNVVESLQTINYTTVMQDPAYLFHSYHAAIPLQVAFRTQHWYANLGVKMAIPMKNKHLFSVSGTETSAEVAGMGAITPDSPIASSMGCTRTDALNVPCKTESSRFMTLLAIDGGYTIVENPELSWTIGIYGEYAINSFGIKGDGIVMTANSDASVSKNINPVSVSPVGYFGFGIKLQCDLGIRSSEQ